MDGFLRSLRKQGGWAGGGTGPNAQDWLRFLDINKIEMTVLYPTQGLDPWRDSRSRLGDLHGQGLQRLALQ